MFGLFKERPLDKIIGQVERVGVLPCGEDSNTYIFKLKGESRVYDCVVRYATPNKNSLGFTKENDQVSFFANEKGLMKVESFENLTFNV